MSRPKISYGDILNSMNVSLVNGVLMYNRGDVSLPQQQHQQVQQPQQQQTTTKQVKITSAPIPEEIKQSKVYNKYFKNYRDPSEPQIEVQAPTTIEEYKKMVLEDKVKRFLAQKRAERIKSTKMIFANPQVGFSVSPGFTLGQAFHFKPL
jgi:hypothetical protein